MFEALSKDLRRRMDAALEAHRKELTGIRTGKASISLLDTITVEYYNTPTPLNQVAALSTPEPNLIVAKPYDVSIIGDMEKAIRKSDLGLNPSNDGKLIRIPIPPLTEERRQQLAKHVHKVQEHGHNEVRQIRRAGNDEMKKMEKEKKISKDEEKRGMEMVQKLHDEYIKKFDDLAKAKEDEILHS
ncbi:ribosome recycling factor [bacterium]|nr:ribosome recycling factor [bacterium]MCI0606776.1 ribosome recycling factor [bacterium]